MGTSATIEVPFTNYKKYYVESDGYPSEMVEYLKSHVEDAMQEAEEKYKNPEEHWLEQLELEMESLTEGYYSELQIYNNQFVNYRYKITEEGKVLYKEGKDEEWDT